MLGRFLTWYGWRRLERHVFVRPRHYIQYSARHRDGSRTIYPSEAAYRNDPVWDRGGAVTEARAIDAEGRPLTGWTGVYPKDPKAIRREWDD